MVFLLFCFNVVIAFYFITLTLTLSLFLFCLFIVLKKGAFLDIVAKCEISRVLLLMLLEVSLLILYVKTRYKDNICLISCP